MKSPAFSLTIHPRPDSSAVCSSSRSLPYRGVSHLETQRVACAQPRRGKTVGLAGHGQGVPDGGGGSRGNIEFETVFPGVPGTADHALRVCHRAFGEAVVPHRIQVHFGEGREDLLTGRALQRDQGNVVGVVRDLDIEPGRVISHPRPVLFPVACVHDENEVVGEAVDQKVVEDAPIFVAEGRVLCAARHDARRVVDRQVLDQRLRLRPTHGELAHVGHVEKACGSPDSGMFRADAARVLDRHLVAREGHHPGTQRGVNVVERRLDQCVVHCLPRA